MELTERQSEIVEQAIRLIAKKGMSQLTVKKLAAAVGLSEAALYRHFPGKRDILAAILSHFFVLSQINLHGEIDQSEPALTQMQQYFMARANLFAKNPHLAKLMLNEFSFDFDPELAQRVLKIMQSHKQLLQKIIAAAIQQNSINRNLAADDVFITVVGALRLLATRWLLNDCQGDLNQQAGKLWSSLKIMLV